MGLLQDLRISRAPAAGLAVAGICWGSFAAWLPEIKQRVGVSDAEFGALMLLSASGGMVSMMIAPRLRARFGTVVLPLSALPVALVVLFPALVETRAGLAAVLLMTGFSMSLCDILANIRISDIEARVGHSLMNVNHAIFSLSLGVTAGLMGLARRAEVAHLPAAMAVLIAILALIPLMRRRRVVPGQVSHDDDGHSGVTVPAPWFYILPGALILWLSCMAENGVESWGALHIERSLGLAGGLGAFGPAMFGLAMGLARLAGQELVLRLGELRLIALSVLIATVGAIALALAPGLAIALMGAAALGLGVAVVVPSANTLIARSVPEEQRASAIARSWMIGFTGFFVGPPLIGFVSQVYDLRVAFGLIALMVALMLPCLWQLSRRLLR